MLSVRDVTTAYQGLVAISSVSIDVTKGEIVCVAGANACPPEDVGGTPGYMDFLHAMRDPQHEEHGAMWLWWGGPFDANGFDLNAANRAIRRLR